MSKIVLFLVFGIAQACAAAECGLEITKGPTPCDNEREALLYLDATIQLLTDAMSNHMRYGGWDALLYAVSQTYTIKGLAYRKEGIRSLLKEAASPEELIQRKHPELGKNILEILDTRSARASGLLDVVWPHLSDDDKTRLWRLIRAQDWIDAIDETFINDDPTHLETFWREHPHSRATRLLTRCSWDKKEGRAAFFEAIDRKKTRVAAALLADADKAGLWENAIVAQMYPRRQALKDLWVALWEKIIDALKTPPAEDIIESTLSEIEAFSKTYDPSRSMLFEKLWSNETKTVMEINTLQEHEKVAQVLAQALAEASPLTIPDEPAAGAIGILA